MPHSADINPTSEESNMKIKINLGITFAEITGEAPLWIQMAMPPTVTEIDPDSVFDALQRVGILDESGMHATADEHDQADVDRIAAKYGDNAHSELLQTLRLLLDTCKAPSMSVGDSIELYSMSGQHVVTHTCESIGWTSGHRLDIV